MMESDVKQPDYSVIIRPPSEADSYLLALTSGCSHNRCTFCCAYKHVPFAIRNVTEIKTEIDRVAQKYGDRPLRVFLENGDALICRQIMLREILQYLNLRFPRLGRISSYASPQSLLHKSVTELAELRELGLRLLYLGVETGDEHLLQTVCKGVNVAQMVESGQKVKAAGISLSATIILGLGGVSNSLESARATGRVLSKIDPEFCGALTLMLEPGAPLYDVWRRGEFILAPPFQTILELREIIAASHFGHCYFTSSHASNYLNMRLRLPEEKEAGLAALDRILAGGDEGQLRPEYFRAL
jgi:radical SAM superfamily enzyme YgiQ (UPF0313 family)